MSALCVHSFHGSMANVWLFTHYVLTCFAVRTEYGSPNSDGHGRSFYSAFVLFHTAVAAYPQYAVVGSCVIIIECHIGSHRPQSWWSPLAKKGCIHIARTTTSSISQCVRSHDEHYIYVNLSVYQTHGKSRPRTRFALAALIARCCRHRAPGAWDIDDSVWCLPLLRRPLRNPFQHSPNALRQSIPISHYDCCPTKTNASHVSRFSRTHYFIFYSFVPFLCTRDHHYFVFYVSSVSYAVRVPFSVMDFFD